MDLIKLLNVATAKNTKETLNTFIEEYNSNNDTINTKLHSKVNAILAAEYATGTAQMHTDGLAREVIFDIEILDRPIEIGGITERDVGKANFSVTRHGIGMSIGKQYSGNTNVLEFSKEGLTYTDSEGEINITERVRNTYTKDEVDALIKTAVEQVIVTGDNEAVAKTIDLMRINMEGGILATNAEYARAFARSQELYERVMYGTARFHNTVLNKILMLEGAYEVSQEDNILTLI